MTITFLKYPSLTNHYAVNKYINQSKRGGCAKGAIYQPIEEYILSDNFIGVKHKTKECQEKRNPYQKNS